MHLKANRNRYMRISKRGDGDGNKKHNGVEVNGNSINYNAGVQFKNGALCYIGGLEKKDINSPILHRKKCYD